MYGGAGADLYVVDTVGNRTIEVVNDGTDTVRSSVSHTLADNVEYPELTSGAGDVDATGNALANTITGNEGDEVHTGAAGSDTFVFASFWGKDEIGDFEVGADKLDLSDVAGIDGLEDLQVSEVEGNAVISFQDDTITLVGVTAGTLSETDFLL